MKKNLIFLLLIANYLVSCQDPEEFIPPTIPITNGGEDFLDVGEFNVRLNADSLKSDQYGIWKIHSGLVDDKVSFENTNDPKTIFNGLPGEEYKLLWEVRKGSKTTTDTVIVSFLSLQTEIADGFGTHYRTRVELNAKSYDRGKWTIEGNYHHIWGQSGGGISRPDEENPNIIFYGFENTSYKITWTTWYGSKSASATYEYNSTEYHQDEALEDLGILYNAYNYKRNQNGDVIEISLIGDGRAWKFQYIEEFPALKSLIHLKKLELPGDGLQIFPEVITSSYHRLNYLSVSHNYFKSLPDDFGNLKELDTLILSNNLYFESIPNSFGDLTKLRFLDATSLSIKSLPESFSNLTSLVYLDLDQNTIEKLPEQIGNLRNLETFRGPKLSQSIPNSFSNLSKLEFCFFTVTSPDAVLPEDFGRLTELNTLWLYGNYKSLPSSFANLVKLKDFVAINGSGLSSIPENIGNLVNLTKLHLTIKLNVLPTSFSNLVNLQYLSLQGELNYLPNDIGNLEKLEEFGASYVKLKEIPESIGNLKNIKVLILAANEISSIPASIGNLSKITVLNVARNKIITFPPSIANLSNTLRQLFINGNNYSEDELIFLIKNLPNTTITTWIPGDD